MKARRGGAGGGAERVKSACDGVYSLPAAGPDLINSCEEELPAMLQNAVAVPHVNASCARARARALESDAACTCKEPCAGAAITLVETPPLHCALASRAASSAQGAVSLAQARSPTSFLPPPRCAWASRSQNSHCPCVPSPFVRILICLPHRCHAPAALPPPRPASLLKASSSSRSLSGACSTAP